MPGDRVTFRAERGHTIRKGIATLVRATSIVVQSGKKTAIVRRETFIEARKAK